MREPLMTVIAAAAGAALGAAWATQRVTELLRASDGIDRPWTGAQVPAPPANASVADLIGYLTCAAKRSLEKA
jgi:hypothetical protein